MAESLAVPAGLILAAMLTRALGPEAYGRYGIAVAVVLAIEWLLISSTARASLRLLSDPATRDEVAPQAVRHHFIAGMAVMIVTITAATLLGRVPHWQNLAADVRWLSLDILVASLCQAQRNILTVRADYRLRSYSIAIRWIARVAATWALLDFGVHGAILAWPVSAVAELALIRSLPLRGILHDWRTPPELWKNSLAQILFGVGQRSLERSDLLVLQASTQPAQTVGIYVAAQNLSILPALFGAAMSPILLAALTRERSLGREASSRQAAVAAFKAGLYLLPLAPIFFYCGEDITRLVFGHAYSGAARLTGFLVAACIGILLLSTAASVLTSQGKERIAAAVSLGTAIPSIAAQIWIVPRFGAVGLAAVGMGSGLFSGLLAAGLVYRLWGERLPYEMLLRALAAVGCVLLFGKVDVVADLAWPLRGALLSLAAAATILMLGEWRSLRSGAQEHT
jgi:O-antigen/teichoic acid export membrane protein